MPLRVFFDGRNKKIYKALRSIGGIKCQFKLNPTEEDLKNGYSSYRNLNSYDYIIEKDDDYKQDLKRRILEYERLKDSPGYTPDYSLSIWISHGDYLWVTKTITEKEFFDIVNIQKNIELIKSL